MKTGGNKPLSRQLRGSGLPRNLILEYFHAKCKRCGSTRELQFDHITPIEKGGQDALSNLQLLCRNCHLRKHRRENLMTTSAERIGRIQRHSLYRGYQRDFDPVPKPGIPRNRPILANPIWEEAPVWKDDDDTVWVEEGSNPFRRIKPWRRQS
jgi:hypothetical protein